MSAPSDKAEPATVEPQKPASWRDAIKVHPAADMLPPILPDESRELGEDIKANGMRVQIVLFRDTPYSEYFLLDGRNRLDAMELAGLPTTRTRDGKHDSTPLLDWQIWAAARKLDGAPETNEPVRIDPYGYVLSLNLHRRHLTVEQRREIAAALLKADPSKSDRRVAAESGLNRTDVGVERKKLEQTGEVSIPDTRIGKDGVAQPAKPPAPKPAPAAPLPATAASRDEWYTPSTILDPARKVLGHFHLDPASCDLAQEKVQARRYFTKAEDGLAQDWTAASVWLNPPYGQPHVAGFVAKLLAEYRAGRVKSAILLVNNCTCTAWFHDAAAAASALCFPRGRIAFYGPNGETGDAGPRQGQALLHFGNDVAAFVQTFSELGFVAYPARTPARLEEAVEPPIAATEPADIACTRPKGCGYGGCKAEGRCLYDAAAPKPPVVLKPSDAELARQEAQRAAQPTCTRRGGCVNTSRVNGCWRTGRCGHPDGYESATPEIDLAKAAAPSKAVN
jgi:phage N-6-adenine-methyltransferase